MRNNAISIMRVMAMIMIVLCHLFLWLDMSVLAMFFNVGVEVFLLISGYLYSNREIKNTVVFLKQRWIKICVPLYTFFIAMLFVNLMVQKDLKLIKTIPVYFLDLQGVNFVLKNVWFPNLNELSHLWFLTVIMMSYILLVLVKKIEKETFWINKQKVCFLFAIFLIADVMFALIGIQLIYFFTFFVGYAIGKMNIRFDGKRYVFLSIMMLLSVAIRISGKRVLDDTVLYNSIIAQVTHVGLSIWIFATVFYTYEKKSIICDCICGNKMWKWFEKESMMIYITHQIFLTGSLDVKHIGMNTLIEIIIFVVATISTAEILRRTSEIIQERLENVIFAN